MKNRTISVKGTEVTVTTRHEQDYISLTDMIKGFGDETILYGWLRNKNTVEFLGIWEQLNNPDFKPLEFDRFHARAGSPPTSAAVFPLLLSGRPCGPWT